MSQSKCSSPASTANSRSSLTRSQALPSLPACARRCSRHAGPTIRRANGSLGGHKPPQSQRCAWSPRWLCCNSAQYAELHGRLRCPSSARMTRHQLHNLLRQRVQRPVASPSVAASRVARTDRLAPRTVAERSADEAFQAEILVPPDERDALASLIANLRRRQDDQVALAQPAIVPSSGPAESASLAQPADVPGQPLEIAELKVDPLRPAEEK
jgi:hypothetical protein